MHGLTPCFILTMYCMVSANMSKYSASGKSIATLMKLRPAYTSLPFINTINHLVLFVLRFLSAICFSPSIS